MRHAVSIKKSPTLFINDMLGGRDDTSCSLEADSFSSPMVSATTTESDIGDRARVPSMMIRNFRTVLARAEDDRTDGQVPNLSRHLSRLQILSPFGQAEDYDDSSSSTRTEVRTTPDSGNRRLSLEHYGGRGSKVPGEIQESISSRTSNRFLINPGGSQTTNAMSTPNQQMYNIYHQVQQPHCVTDDSARPRSRAVAIKSHDRCAEDLALSQNEESSEKMYDWATWQMYNRIVDHRRNQRFNTALPTANDRPEPSHDERLPSSHLSSDYVYEGEVFELDI